MKLPTHPLIHPSSSQRGSHTPYGDSVLMNNIPEDHLRIHAFLPRSRANGPGWRAVIWTQGCSIRCPGCFNPSTHDPAGGTIVPVSELFYQITALGDSIEGITISGGEPLDQAPSLVKLLSELRTLTSLSVIMFSGHSYGGCLALPHANYILRCTDVLIAGPYRQSNGYPRNGLFGCWKTVHFLTSRYHEADFAIVPDAEVIITPDASVDFTGLAAGAYKSE